MEGCDFTVKRRGQIGTSFFFSDRQAHQVFLNDWASAVDLNKEALFYGAAIQYAADEILRAGAQKVVARRSHDMEMLVKLMFACMHPEHYRAAFPRLHVDQPQVWSDTHRVLEQGAPTGAVGQALQGRGEMRRRRSVRYDELKELIRKNLPSVWAAP